MVAQPCCGTAVLRAAMPIATLHVLCYIFVHKFLFNAHFDLEPDYIVRKPIRHRFQLYILFWEILSTFHTRVEHISHVMLHIEKNRAQMPKNARNSPFPLTHEDLHLTHECLGPAHSPRQMTARSLYAFPHSNARKFPLVIMGRQRFTPKTAPSPSTITTKI